MTNKIAYNAIINNAQKSNTGRMNAVIPVEMIDVDPAYQRVESRNERKIRKLRDEWDYNLMDALLVVPHPETYNFFVVDGLGRLTVAKEIGLEELDCVVIPGPLDPKERRKFEAKYFLRQSDCTDAIRPVQKHNALVLNGDAVALAIDQLCKEYNVKIVSNKGARDPKKLGSYASTFRLVKAKGKNALEYAFNVIKEAGFDNEANGYAAGMIEAFASIYDAYGESVSYKAVGDYLRKMNVMTFKSRAIGKYPERYGNGGKVAMILFLQDWIVKERGGLAMFDNEGKNVVVLKTA